MYRDSKTCINAPDSQIGIMQNADTAMQQVKNHRTAVKICVERGEFNDRKYRKWVYKSKCKERRT